MPVRPALRVSPPRRQWLIAALLVGAAIVAFPVLRHGIGWASGPLGPVGMRWIPAGEFTMGSNNPKARPDEAPAHQVRIDGFWIDETTVTNAQFRKFVEATGYITISERATDWEELKKQVPPGTPKPSAEMLAPGSPVFQPTDAPVPLSDWSRWWRWQPGANWRHPGGPDTSIDGKDDYPVVQVAWEDAMAYAKWVGKRLPTEAEWEFAARGGLDGKLFAWGDSFEPNGKPLANTWQGNFPATDTGEDGYKGTSPVRFYAPNDYGLYDMTGNVWQHVADWYRPDTYRVDAAAGIAVNPTGPDRGLDPSEPYTPKRVIRGGSFLCSEVFCFSYRPAARMSLPPDTGLPNVGFRLAASR